MWVKICGIRDQATATEIAALAPDAVGLNFYRKSPRSLVPSMAAEITSSLPANVEPVGLFVNETVESIHEICLLTGLRSIQLHGDESPELLKQLAERDSSYRFIRAWNPGNEGLDSLRNYLERLGSLNVSLSACLIDARVPGMHGGTGKKVDWDLLRREYHQDEWPPLILAGGLTPDNVADAIQAVQPWGVDVASGVESSPAVKDMARVEQFIRAAREAFDSLNRNVV